MRHLIYIRLVAFGIDYIIIAAYALLLFGITKILNLKELVLTPVNGQLLGFISLTLPVFLYFFLTEKGKSRATIGKRIMNISITAKTDKTKPKILLRNILKFSPWEVAHIGVHWIVFYSISDNNVPIWVWFLLILPQIIVMAYLLGVIISKGESGIYDSISNTKIKRNPRTTHVDHIG